MFSQRRRPDGTLERTTRWTHNGRPQATLLVVGERSYGSNSLDIDLSYFHAGGYDGISCDVDLVHRCGEVDVLEIRNASACAFRQLGDLGYVKQLSVRGPNDGGVGLDLRQFGQLELLATPGHKDVQFPAEMPKLTDLFLGAYLPGGRESSRLPLELPALVAFSFGTGSMAALPALPEAPLALLNYFFGRVPDLGEFHRYASLGELNVQQQSRLHDVRVLQHLSALRRASFDGCRKLSDLAPLQSCVNLQELFIINCAPLPSLDFLSSMTRLREFHCVTKIVDGDLTPLIGIEKLNIDHRRHYSHTEEELLQLTLSGATGARSSALPVFPAHSPDVHWLLPTDDWRDRMAEGSNSFTEDGLSAFERILREYMSSVHQLSVDAAQEDALLLLEATVKKINGANRAHDHPIDTVEREELVQFLLGALADVLPQAGDDPTEDWREW